MAEKSIHIVDLKTADSITGEEYLVLQDAGGITYTPVTDAEAPSFEAGKYFQAQSDGTYIALETCPDNWQTMYNQCYTRTIPDTQKVPVKLIAGKVIERIKYYDDPNIIPSLESYFTVNETGETITGLTDTGKTQTELVIPYKINGKEITTLYSGVDYSELQPQSILDGSTTITKITIPKSVTTLGRGAFYNCASLTSINIPSSITSIGESAFQGTSLTSINIPNSVTSIGQNTFAYCSSLTSVNIPNSVTSIGRETFYSCTSLTSINIPNSVTSIGQSAFYNCASLTSINIPNSVTSIGEGAFDNCTSLTSVSIPNNVTSIGVAAFNGCTALTKVVIPNSVTSIGYYAFYNCTSLTSINIPNSVTNIRDDAFYECTNLTIYCEQGSYAETYANTNNIPVVYTDVSDIATETELERLKYYDDKDIIPSDENYFTVNETKETITGLTNTGKTQTELVIPYEIDGVKITTLYSGVDSGQPQSILNGSTTITKIIIPKSVTNLMVGVFKGCTSLTSVNIPNSVTDIGTFAFNGCTSLTSINIPNSVTSIGDIAFNSCTSLTSINIPNSVTSIGMGAFGGCTNLTIYCEQGSCADTYAKTNNIPVVYTDISATDFNNKVDKATTLEGYGITDAYTKTEVDTKISTINNTIGDINNILSSVVEGGGE